jgi:predicted ATPase
MKNLNIVISNVGPIEHVELNLNKINVLMGEQSSGKSTIAKIISFCNWVEKDVSINQSFKTYNSDENFFIERLETFHKMKGYFNPNSYIKYSSETLIITYSWQNFNIKWVDKFAYKRNKISYIPAERSLAVLPEIEKVEFPNNYLKSFLFDWLDARKNYSKKSKLPLIDINIDFYHSESTKESHVFNSKKDYDILLSQASSGLQSITPLLVMIDHLTNKIYSEEQSSYVFDEIRMEVTQKLISELIIKPLYNKDFDDDLDGRRKVLEELNKKVIENDKEVMKYLERFRLVRDGLFETHSTNFILEEPEQNLFPSTQKSLVYYLFECINKNPEHRLTLTTHSPYVLYAINNCIMAHLTQNKMIKSEADKLYCDKSKIDPSLISIYELKNGKIQSIQQEDGLIGDNFFDMKMKEVMNEFYVMLNHY